MPDRMFVPALFALVGFFVGFMLVVPLGCTVQSMAITEGRTTTTSLADDTSCSSAIGIDYSGSGSYNPPLWPAVLAGLLAASAAFALAALLQVRHRQQVTAHTLGWVGIALNATWSLFLAGIALFNDGSLDPQWRTSLLFVGLTALPAALALCGLRDRPALLLTAGIVCIPLSFISLAGATLPLLLPALFYIGAYIRSPMSEHRDRSPWAHPPPAG